VDARGTGIGQREDSLPVDLVLGSKVVGVGVCRLQVGIDREQTKGGSSLGSREDGLVCLPLACSERHVPNAAERIGLQTGCVCTRCERNAVIPEAIEGRRVEVETVAATYSQLLDWGPGEPYPRREVQL
jgi:hypothetical protein